MEGALMRTPIIAGNWKMNFGRVEQATAFVRKIRTPLNNCKGVERVICPPFTVLYALADVLGATEIGLGGQNMHWEEQGAHTGEISPVMLADTCQYVILGHSERRAQASQADSDAAIQRKVAAALEHELTPIICVGENAGQREAGETHTWVSAQVASALDGLTPDQVSQVIFAYEPLWAIGSGQPATAAEANRVIGLTIRGKVAELFGEGTAAQLRVQYGGSVTAENIAEFMAMPEIDGALVGGASLKESFVDLVRAAAQ
jgi:triosephosphate isomerase